MIVVDYLQLLTPENPRDPRHEQVSQMSRRLKAVARELNVPILCLAQLNREAEKAERPRLSHLRESGAIEQDADVVMFLHRPGTGSGEANDRGEAQLVIEKNRHGQTGEIDLEWLGSETRFRVPGSEGHDEFAGFAG